MADGMFGPGIFGTGIDLSALDMDTAWRLGLFMGEQLKAAEQLGREKAASDLETFANRCKTRAESVASEMTECANWGNLGTVETIRQAANIARVGADYKNPNCTNCRDTRGGAVDHPTEFCTWSPPEGVFSDRDQCRGMMQVGWLGPYGIIPGGMDNDPAPNWRPIYVKRPII